MSFSALRTKVPDSSTFTNPLSLKGRLISVTELQKSEVESMLALFSRNFSGADSRVFEQDLREKDWAIWLEDQDGRLQGFTSFKLYPSKVTSKPTLVVCSGDTIVSREAWGTPVLAKTWIRGVYSLYAQYPGYALNWLLLTSGFRTYRFMPIFCLKFQPSYNSEPDQEEREMLTLLAKERYGELYDPKTGIVRFPKPQVLRDHISDIPQGRLSDPHIDFFLQRNPGHIYGDELVSLASMELANLTPAGRRVLERD